MKWRYPGYLKVHGHTLGAWQHPPPSTLHCVLPPSALMPHANGACPALDYPPGPSVWASFVIAPLVDDMAQIDPPEPSQHAFNPDAILGAFTQSSADAFKYASSPEKRNRLLDELLKRKDSLFEATLTCMLFKIRKICSLTRYTR